MPIKHSALKQIRKDRKRALRNQAVQTQLKTVRKHWGSLLAEQHYEEARQLLPVAIKRFDQAAARGAIHKNTAARVKSQLTRQLAAPPSSQKPKAGTTPAATTQAPPATPGPARS